MHARGPNKPSLVGRLPRGLLAPNSPPLGQPILRGGRGHGGSIEVREDVLPVAYTVANGAAAPVVLLQLIPNGIVSSASMGSTGVHSRSLALSTGAFVAPPARRRGGWLPRRRHGMVILASRASTSLPKHRDELGSVGWATLGYH